MFGSALGIAVIKTYRTHSLPSRTVKEEVSKHACAMTGAETETCSRFLKCRERRPVLWRT